MKTIKVPESNLYSAFLRLKNEDEIRSFLKDLCTPQEISVMQESWRVCQLLEKGDRSYRDIHGMTGASLTTITRVARFLKDEPHKGYRIVLNRIRRTGKL